MRMIIFSVILIIISLMGYWSGKTAGTGMLSGFVGNKRINAVLFYRPASQYYEIYRLLNSGSDLDRMAGYYALIDNNIIDEDFLMERYSLENIDTVKRTIVWVMGFSKDREKIRNFFDARFSGSAIAIKGEIIRSLKRLDMRYLDEFIKKNSVTGDLLKD